MKKVFFHESVILITIWPVNNSEAFYYLSLLAIRNHAIVITAKLCFVVYTYGIGIKHVS